MKDKYDMKTTNQEILHMSVKTVMKASWDTQLSNQENITGKSMCQEKVLGFWD